VGRAACKISRVHVLCSWKSAKTGRFGHIHKSCRLGKHCVGSAGGLSGRHVLEILRGQDTENGISQPRLDKSSGILRENLIILSKSCFLHDTPGSLLFLFFDFPSLTLLPRTVHQSLIDRRRTIKHLSKRRLLHECTLSLRLSHALPERP